MTEEEAARLWALVESQQRIIEALTAAVGARGTGAAPEAAHHPRQDIPAPPGRLSAAEKGCRVEGCRNPHRAGGLCAAHYQMAKRGTLPGA